MSSGIASLRFSSCIKIAPVLGPHMAKKKLRPVGDIMLDMEKLLFELHIDHDLQHGEVLYLVNGWQKVHVPEHIETYTAGGHPVLYGPLPNKFEIRDVDGTFPADENGKPIKSKKRGKK